MVSWKVINDKIRACQRLPDREQRIQCLTRLLDQFGRDGSVLFALGEEYEQLDNKTQAAKYFSEAADRFPYPEFQQQAQRALLRIGVPIPEVPRIEPQPYTTIDGHRVRSRGEAMIDDWLHHHKILHEYEKKVPVEDFIVCDFYLPEYDVYLEYWGMPGEEAEKRKQYKLALYEQNKLRIESIGNDDLVDLELKMSEKLRYPRIVGAGRYRPEDRTEFEVIRGQRNYASQIMEEMLGQLRGEVIGTLDFIDKTTFAYLDKIPKTSGIKILTSNTPSEQLSAIQDAARRTAHNRPFLKVVEIKEAKLHMRWIGSSSSFFIDIGADLKSDALGMSTHTIRKVDAALFNEQIKSFDFHWKATEKQLSDLQGKEVKKELIFDSVTAKHP